MDCTEIAIGAFVDDDPVGLAFGRVTDDRHASLLSVFVMPAMRGRGIGRRLVERITEAMRRREATILATRISGTNPARIFFEQALIGAGWTSLECTEIRLIGIAAAMAEETAGWRSVDGRLIHGMSTTFDRWSSLEEHDWSAIDALLRDGGFVDRKRLQIPRLDPEVSVVIRHQGQPVGWVIGLQIEAPLSDYADATAINFTNAHVSKHFSRRGTLIGALWHAFSRQAAAYGPRSLAMYHSVRPRMVALSRRRFAPIALSADEVFESRCLLT